MDYAALAKQFGGVVAPAPTPAISPPGWAANLSQKDQGEIQMRMYAEGRKRLADLQGDISSAGSTMSDLNEFGRLNRENSTGSIWQQLTPDKAMFRSGPSMEMAAIQARLAPAQREAGSGASSDRDVALYLRGLPSLENEGPTNRGIREDYERKYNAAIEKSKAMQKHLDTYGNLTDFDGRWAERKRPAQPAPASQVGRSDLAAAAAAELARRKVKP